MKKLHQSPTTVTSSNGGKYLLAHQYIAGSSIMSQTSIGASLYVRRH
jgi:hypothetical protein